MTKAGVITARANVMAALSLLIVASASWLLLLRGQPAMVMPGISASASDAALFTAQWGLMMTAMMLPSASPMILLYRTVRSRMPQDGRRAIPATAFAATYLGVWLLTGLPVYAVSIFMAGLAASSRALHTAAPYLLALTLVAAGLYQFSAVKRACLRYCESPMSFLMRRWKNGYLASFRNALAHAFYCVGCCWALMVILVAAGAMSLPWVLAITFAVVAEKMLPRGWHTARLVGLALILLGIAMAIRPELAMTLRGEMTMQMAH